MNPVRHYRARAASAIGRMRGRGYRLLPLVMLHMPRMVLLRAYRVLARRMNRSAVFRRRNARTLDRLHAGDARYRAGGHFYVIVMPGTLHFLVPCLALLPSDLAVVLVCNGAVRWERELLKRKFPRLPMIELSRMPETSLTHGDVITLLLCANAGNFGLLDHDCYVFDRAVFDSLAPGPRDCLSAVFGGISARTGLPYPETYLLYLNTQVLCGIMRRYNVEARIYPVAPARVRDLLARIGIGPGVYVKENKRFFDTLHLMLALAGAEGFEVAFLHGADERAIAHIGGTSWQTRATKELVECYVDWRFLEMADDEVRRRYARRFRPFDSAAQVRAAIPMTPEAFAKIAWADALVDRLASTRCTAGPALPQAQPSSLPA